MGGAPSAPPPPKPAPPLPKATPPPAPPKPLPAPEPVQDPAQPMAQVEYGTQKKTKRANLNIRPGGVGSSLNTGGTAGRNLNLGQS